MVGVVVGVLVGVHNILLPVMNRIAGDLLVLAGVPTSTSRSEIWITGLGVFVADGLGMGRRHRHPHRCRRAHHGDAPPAG